VHLGEPIAPGRERHPHAAYHDDDFDSEISEQARSALVVVWPDRKRGIEREYENQSGARANHCRALLRALLGAALLLALHLLESGRRLRRKSVELPLDFFQLC